MAAKAKFQFVLLLILIFLLEASSSITQSALADENPALRANSAANGRQNDFQGASGIESDESFGTISPKLLVSDLRSLSVAESLLEDRRVVLYFWSIYCRGCSDVSRELSSMQKKFVDDKIVFVPVHLFELDKDKVSRVLKKWGVDLPVIFAPKGMRDKFSVRLLPALLIFDQQKSLIARYDGLLDSDVLKSEIFVRLEKIENNGEDQSTISGQSAITPDLPQSTTASSSP